MHPSNHIVDLVRRLCFLQGLFAWLFVRNITQKVMDGCPQVEQEKMIRFLGDQHQEGLSCFGLCSTSAFLVVSQMFHCRFTPACFTIFEVLRTNVKCFDFQMFFSEVKFFYTCFTELLNVQIKSNVVRYHPVDLN